MFSYLYGELYWLGKMLWLKWNDGATWEDEELKLYAVRFLLEGEWIPSLDSFDL